MKKITIALFILYSCAMFPTRSSDAYLVKGISENNDSTDFSGINTSIMAQHKGDSVKRFETIRTDIKVLPTISDKEFYVFNPKDEAITCCVLTIQGQKLAEIQLLNLGINELELSENQQGMYILIFKDINGTVIGKQKVIKQ